jgi:hypothetical protein
MLVPLEAAREGEFHVPDVLVRVMERRVVLAERAEQLRKVLAETEAEQMRTVPTFPAVRSTG